MSSVLGASIVRYDFLSNVALCSLLACIHCPDPDCGTAVDIVCEMASLADLQFQVCMLSVRSEYRLVL